MSENSAGAPLGAVAVDSSSSSTASPNTTATPSTQSTQATADPIEINPDGMYRIPGVEKPVKFSDHVRGFQAQATKASQRAAELERKLQESERQRQRFEQERHQQPQQNQPQGDVLADMRSKPYLSGEELAGAFTSVAAEINARDQITIAILKQLKAMQQVLSPMYESTQNQAFSGKIGNWLQAGGYGEEYRDIAEELYLAYEPGQELDEAFPELLKQRISQVEQALERKRRVAAESARRAPFVPGRGGNAAPSRPFQPNPRNTARQDVDELWDSIQVGPGT